MPTSPHCKHHPTFSCPTVDPEQPAMQTATSAPAAITDDGKHADQAASHHVTRAKSDPTGQRHKPQKDTLTREQERTLQHMKVRAILWASCWLS